MRHASLLAILLALGCGDPTLRGATSVASGHEPRGRSGSSLFPTDCRDAAGRRVSTSVEHRLVQDQHGRWLLVQKRPGYDSVVVHHREELPHWVVYRFVGARSHGSELVHSIRFPRGGGPAEWIVLGAFDTDRPDQTRVMLVCRLDRQRTLE